MSGLRRPVRIFVCLTMFAAAFVLSVAISTLSANWLLVDLLIAAGLAVLMNLASIYELRVSRQTSVTLNTSIILTAVLLLNPVLAMLVAGSGIVADLRLSQMRWTRAVFGASESMVQAGLAGLFLVAAGWNRSDITFSTSTTVAMVVVVGLVLVLVNSLAVATVVGLQTRQSILRQWWNDVRFRSTEEIALLALGVLAAALIDTHPWILPILLLPAAIVYRSLERNIRLQQQTFDAVAALADIVDIRDPYTADHSRQVAEYARQLATALGLDPDDIETIDRAARVHDVGKVVIDSTVLGKVGKLTDDEWEQIKQHPVTGAEILSRFPAFTTATSYVRHHHERLDGKGYPDGISGDAIPLGARIIAVADSLDAMIRARPYRPGLDPVITLAELRRYRGVQWDPAVVDALLKLIDDGEITLPNYTPAPSKTQAQAPHHLPRPATDP